MSPVISNLRNDTAITLRARAATTAQRTNERTNETCAPVQSDVGLARVAQLDVRLLAVEADLSHLRPHRFVVEIEPLLSTKTRH